MLVFLVLSLIGFLIYLSIALAVFKRGGNFTNKETFGIYFEINLFWFIAQILTLVLVSFLLTIEGSEFIIEYSTNKFLNGDTPFQYSLFASLVGLSISVIIDRLRAIIKPVPIQVSEHLK